VIRIPASLVGLALALALAALVYFVARLLGNRGLVALLLPACSAAGGFVAGRWAGAPPVAPGLSVGVICIAARMGLALGMREHLLAFVHPGLALLELLAAMIGGLIGVFVARHNAAPQHKTRPEYTSL